MSTENWNEGETIPAKRRVAPWIWFTCGGCLIALLLGAFVIKTAFDYAKEWSVAEAQLPALGKALPFDPLPPETQFEYAIRFPMDLFIFLDTRGFVLLFFVADGGEGEELRQTMLSADFSGFGLGRRQSAEPAELSVQGRDVRGTRFVQERGTGNGGADAEGPSIVLEVGPEGGAHVVLVQITRAGSSGPVTDEDVRMLLEPFHVGPDR